MVNRAEYKIYKAIIIVYSVTDRDSFEFVEHWIDCIRSRDDLETSFVIIVANKADQEAERVVTEAEGLAYANSKGVDFMEVSAKLWLNIDDLFMKVTQKMMVSALQEKKIGK